MGKAFSNPVAPTIFPINDLQDSHLKVTTPSYNKSVEFTVVGEVLEHWLLKPDGDFR